MPNVRYYLKTPIKKKIDNKTVTRSLIKLRFKYGSGKIRYDFVYTFGESIDPKNWDDRYQKVKVNVKTESNGDYYLNDLLESLKEVLSKAYKAELKNGVPLPETLKKYLDDFRDRHNNVEEKKKDRPTLYTLIDRFINGEIKKSGRREGGREKSDKTLQNYNSTKLHLQTFEEKTKYRIDFDTITLDFFNAYVDFLQKKIVRKTKDETGKPLVGLSHNSIAKDITHLKVFMNKAVSLGYTNNLAFKHEDFSYAEEDTDAVYLKEGELIKLYNTPMPSAKLENVKDLFVFGSFVGLRFSDYTNVKPENIIEEEGDLFLKVKTKKTGETVFVPCHPMVLKIFEKYKDSPNRLPKSISNQRFNEYIKEVCKIAGMTEKGRLQTNPDLELWECISSHTCRRSFATNLYLQGVSPIPIMKVTGHRTEKAFEKYIRVSKLETAKQISRHMKEMWDRSLLKVVA